MHRHLLETDHPLDGLFCSADLVAHQAIGIIRSMGLRVPEDVQVIGFDGLRILGDQEPVCSSIVQPISDLAETAVSIVLSNDFTGCTPLICLPVSYRPGGHYQGPCVIQFFSRFLQSPRFRGGFPVPAAGEWRFLYERCCCPGRAADRLRPRIHR